MCKYFATTNRHENRACPVRYQKLVLKNSIPNCISDASETSINFLVPFLAPVSRKCDMGITEGIGYEQNQTKTDLKLGYLSRNMTPMSCNAFDASINKASL